MKVDKLAWGLLLVLSVIWGSSFILMKRGLQVFDAGQVGAYRIAVAFLIFLPIALREWRHIPPDRWRYLLAAGALGNLFPAFLFAFAQTKMESSVAGILNALTPIFTFIISILFFGQQARTAQIVGLVLGFTGSLAISFVQAGGNIGDFNAYTLLIVVATLFYGISVNLIGTYLSDQPSLRVSAVAITLVGLPALLYLLSTDFLARASASPQGWASLGYITILGVFSTSISLVLFYKLVRITSAVFASFVTYLIPIFALTWASLDGEQLTWLHLVGMAFIISGVYAVGRKQ